MPLRWGSEELFSMPRTRWAPASGFRVFATRLPRAITNSKLGAVAFGYRRNAARECGSHALRWGSKKLFSMP
jgi:hypothetical protein